MNGKYEFKPFFIRGLVIINIAEQIMEYGKARIPYLGILMGENNTDISGFILKMLFKDTLQRKPE